MEAVFDYSPCPLGEFLSNYNATQTGDIVRPVIFPDPEVSFSYTLLLCIVAIATKFMPKRRPRDDQSASINKNALTATDPSLVIKYGVTGRGYICTCSHRLVVTVSDPSFFTKYGVVDEIGRYKMLLSCARKAKLMGNTEYGRKILQEYKKFTKDPSKIGHKTFKELCRMVAANISEKQWMRFVRLHLNLDKDEIEEARLKHCVVTTEQINQIRYWNERPGELDRLLEQEFMHSR